ncbi:MAG: autotransporter outer membrane beta-barrel domain-containing protein, partial [Thermodesulfobacteriota bacterium]
TKVKYGEDAYVFAGGFSIPAGQSAVSIGAGYETSDFNAGTDTNAAGERFMAGLSVAGEIWKRIIADARTQFAKAAWESTSARGEDTYSAKTNITTWSAAIGTEMPFFPGGVFMVVPRLEAGVARVSADSFTETGGGDIPLTVGGLSQTYLRVTPSVTAYAPAGESVNMWITAGADAHLTDPKTDLKAAFSPDDPVNTKGGFERINIRYSAGAEVNPVKGVSVRVAYSGGVSTTFDTLTQTFTARFGVAF